MKLQFLTWVFIACCHLTMAQTWSRISPQPLEIPLRTCSFINDTMGWYISPEGNHVFRTMNGGNTIQQLYSFPDSLLLSKVCFVNSQVGWVGESYLPGLHRTTDGGNTWTPINTPSGYGTIKIQFLDSLRGWFLPFIDTMYATLDGGITWTGSDISTFINVNSFKDFDFADSLHGFAVSRTPEVYKTSDGGVTWTQVISISTGGDFRFCAVEVIDSLNVIFGGEWEQSPDIGFIIRTADGGITWDTVAAPSDQIDEIEFNDSMHGVATTIRSILTTADGGQTWTITPNPYHQWNQILSVSGSNSNSFFISGEASLMLRSDDNGSTWSEQSSHLPWNTTVSISYTDSMHGFVLANPYDSVLVSDVRVYRSSDGGFQWTDVSPQNLALHYTYDMFFLDSLTGWVGGRLGQWTPGVIYRTTDGGNSWMVDTIPTVPQAIRFSDPLNGWAAGYDGKIYKSSDGGASWNLKYTNPNPVYFYNTLSTTDSNHIWAFGNSTSNAAITSSFSSNGGTTWNNVNLSPYSTLYSFFLDNLHGWIEGPGFSVRYTNNGGYTWNLLPALSMNYTLDTFHFTDTLNGFGLSDNDRIATYTIDGGNSWIFESVDTITDIYNNWRVGSFAPSGHALYGGQHSILYKRFPYNISTTTENIESDTPNLIVYPNPTSDVVHIKFAKAPFALILSDVTGREVMRKQYGENSAIDLSYLQRGIYFYFIVDAQKEIHKGKILKW